jgi:hypothetical protein
LTGLLMMTTRCFLDNDNIKINMKEKEITYSCIAI